MDQDLTTSVLDRAAALIAGAALPAGLLGAAAGQEADLAGGSGTEAAIAVAEAKSGQEWGAFAAAAAAFAGAPPERALAYTRFARALGAAGQLASDCQDIWGEDWS